MAQMCEVYQNAHVTIVGACATNSNEGYLTSKPIENGVTLFRIPWNEGSRDLSNRYISVKMGTEDNTREPLHQRAWTLQERFLPPSATHLWPRLLDLEMREKRSQYASDVDWNHYCDLAGLTTIRLGSGGRRFPPAQTTSTAGAVKTVFSESRGERMPEIFRAWKLMVKNYLSRQLSDPRDKLPALSGIVTYFKHVMADEYLAGLWRNHLLFDLSWMTRHGVRPPLWRCPSWSWMSVDGPITFQGDRIEWFKPRVEILDCMVEPLTQTVPFENLKYGSLSIRGYLKLNQSIQDSWPPFAQSSDNQGDFGKIILDSQYENPEQTTEGANCSLRLVEHGIY